VKKHIAPPATVEQMRRTLGITQEDIEVVERVLRELKEEDEDFPYSPSPETNTNSVGSE
jgi:NACalpha-BTF3-like transcription factor